MNLKIVLTLTFMCLLFLSSCKQQERLLGQEVNNSKDQQITQNVVQQFIDIVKLQKSGKSVTNFVPQDSIALYLQILSNALVSDVDTALINVEQRKFNIQLMPSQNGLYAYSYLYTKVLEMRDSLKSILPVNARIYNVEPLILEASGTYSYLATYGQMQLNTGGLGKATNPNTGLNYFASSDQYRFGYGNEVKTSANKIKGGRQGYAEPMLPNGNGLVYEAFGKYVWYGGSSTNSLPTNLNQKHTGAAKMLETYGQNNIFATYGWPSAAPTGYKYVYSINSVLDQLTADYRATFTKSNPWYYPNLITNRTNQMLPGLVAAKFCEGSEILSSYTLPGASVWQPVWLNASQLNYYLNQIPGIYNYIKTNNPITNGKVLYRFDVVPIYDGQYEVNCSPSCMFELYFYQNQWFTPFDPIYFPDGCMHLKYKHKYRFIFATRTLVQDPNAFVGL